MYNKTNMSNLSSGFIDLATFDDIEGFLYAGQTAVTYFIRQHKKSSWFTQVPVVLTSSSGTADFGNSWSVNISRAGDYLLHTWLEVVTPAITPLAAGAIAAVALTALVVPTVATDVTNATNLVGDIIFPIPQASGAGRAGSYSYIHAGVLATIVPGMIGTTDAQAGGIFGNTAVTGFTVVAVTNDGVNTIVTVDRPLTVITTVGSVSYSILNFKNYWAKNFMHNLVEECTVTFNDLIAHKITGEGLDFWAEFNVPAGKRVAYDRMIGAGVETPQETGKGSYFLHGVDANVARTFSLPLPFFFTRESGVALPTAAIPYNDMRINFKFRTLAQLLTSWNPAIHAIVPLISNAVAPASLTASLTAKVYANYAIVSNDERQLMGSTPRDIVIEQNQLAPITVIKDVSNAAPYDIRFSHAVKSLTFALRDVAAGTSTYLSGPGYTNGVGGDGSFSCYSDRTLNQPFELSGTYNRSSPIASAKLLYENTTRIDMPTQYFTQVNPYYHSESVPEEHGLHFYSYSLDATSIDPMGSTNFGKLTNVSLHITPQGTQAATSQVIVGAVNHNVIRVSGGAVGFPVL